MHVESALARSFEGDLAAGILHRAWPHRASSRTKSASTRLCVSYDRDYAYLVARGFQRPGDYNSRFLLLVDGVRLNDAVYDQAPIGTDFPMDMDMVERIEYVPGPGSAVYGSNALLGMRAGTTRRAEASRVAGWEPSKGGFNIGFTPIQLSGRCAVTHQCLNDVLWRGRHEGKRLPPTLAVTARAFCVFERDHCFRRMVVAPSASNTSDAGLEQVGRMAFPLLTLVRSIATIRS